MELAWEPTSRGPPLYRPPPGDWKDVAKFTQRVAEGAPKGRLELGLPAPATAPSWASSSVLWADGAAQVPIPLPLTCPWPASEGGLRTKCDPAIKSIPNQLFSQPTRLKGGYLIPIYGAEQLGLAWVFEREHGVPWVSPALARGTWEWGHLGRPRKLRGQPVKYGWEYKIRGLKMEGQCGHIFPSVYEEPGLLSNSREDTGGFKAESNMILIARWLWDPLVTASGG